MRGQMEPIILASGSLRRHDFFRMLGLPFSIMPSRVDEQINDDLNPRARAETLAERKVNAVRKALDGRNPPWILAADTLIDVDGRVFGKAESKDEAKTMLKTLSGREHKVISALALFSVKTQKVDCRSNESSVRFAELSDAEIEWYLDTGEWQGVAGAYRIQGIAACFISEIRGSYSSIVGLPLHDFYVMLKENGYTYSV